MALAILCSGQGGQHGGMFDLVAADPAGRAALDALGASAVPDTATLFDNAHAQPAVCAVALATWSLVAPRLARRGVAPILCAGYSVGELAAHGCAGGLSHEATIALARRRATAMDAASTPGDGLVAVRGLGRAVVEALCALHGAHVAIVNGDDHRIIGGGAAALAAFARDATARGATVQRLSVAVAAHTPLLASAADAFWRDLEAVAWQVPTVPVLAGTDGSLVTGSRAAIDGLARAIATTIDWAAAMDSVRERGARVCLELGPGNALARMMRERHPTLACRSASDFRSVDALIAWIVDALE